MRVDRRAATLVLVKTAAAPGARGRAAGGGVVRFAGFRNQSEMPRFYDLCDVFVLPSEHEPWGLVVNEVMNAGRPVLVSDHVGRGPTLSWTERTASSSPPATSPPGPCARSVLRDPQRKREMGRRSLDRVAGGALSRTAGACCGPPRRHGAMRLLLVTAEFPSIPGGVGDYTLHLGHALVRSGHEVCVVTSADSRVVGDSEFAVIPTWRAGSGRHPRARPRHTRDQGGRRALPVRPLPIRPVGAPAHLPWLLDAVRSGGRSVVLVCHELFVFEGRFKHRLVGFIQRTALWLAQRRADALVVTTGRRREWLAAHGFNVSE